MKNAPMIILNIIFFVLAITASCFYTVFAAHKLMPNVIVMPGIVYVMLLMGFLSFHALIYVQADNIMKLFEAIIAILLAICVAIIATPVCFFLELRRKNWKYFWQDSFGPPTVIIYLGASYAWEIISGKPMLFE